MAGDSKVSTNFSYSKLAPGLKVALSGSIPDKASGKLSFDYTSDLYVLKGNLGLSATPKAEVSIGVGHSGVNLGAEAGYCTKSSDVTKWSIGAAYAMADAKCSLLVVDKGDTVKAGYVHSLSHNTSVGGEVIRKLGAGTTTFTLGAAHKLESGGSAKAKIDNAGLASVHYETELTSKSKAAFTVQFDSMNLNKAAAVGMSFATSV